MNTILLLTASNTFMTLAWYGHLKYPGIPLWKAVLWSWGIALLEYALQVPANRIGYRTFSVTQLKILQEVITLTVFTLFAMFAFGERPQWNHLVSYGFLVLAAAFGLWQVHHFPHAPVK